MSDHKTTEVTITLTEKEQGQIQEVTGKLIGRIVVVASDGDSSVSTKPIVDCQVRP